MVHRQTASPSLPLPPPPFGCTCSLPLSLCHAIDIDFGAVVFVEGIVIRGPAELPSQPRIFRLVGLGAAAQMMCKDSHHFLAGDDELDIDVGGGCDADHAEAKQSGEEGFHPCTWTRKFVFMIVFCMSGGACA
jgi:hypothetical protein